MNKLNYDCFPSVSSRSISFKTKTGLIFHGKYCFNKYNQRRWITDDGEEYSSNVIDEWEYDEKEINYENN